MQLDYFEYDLPEELIAQKAVSPRDACKLLVLDRTIQHAAFSNLDMLLRKGDILVLNETKVIEAKIRGKKTSGADAEIVILKPVDGTDGKNNTYECKIKTKRPRAGVVIVCDEKKRLLATIIAQKNIDTFIVQLSHPLSLFKKELPAPPYIRKKVTEKEYQTIFAKKEGSLAAPTAGLHFTKALLAKIAKKGVKIEYITLHVSYGTFKNIEGPIEKHQMDPEYFEVSGTTAKAINNRKGRLIVVGTTTLKALESCAYRGHINAKKAESNLFIHPPYSFQSGTDVLITNFHLPKSTLLLLTCAFGETERVLNAYREAVKKRYRFFSLGDAMMIYRRQPNAQCQSNL